MNDVAGKVALITGAKGGLGTFVTEALLNAGATVVGVSRSIRASDFTHPNFTPMPAELSDSRAAASLVEAVVARFERIDVLAHLMGGFAGGEPVAATPDETLERMLDLNLRSAFYLARAVVPHMRGRRAGRIIAIGSRAAVEPSARVGAYSLSKAALVALIRTLAIENRDAGITANIVLPGTMDTPANRAADPNADFTAWVPPARVASLVLWLASDAASEVTGAAIPIYGRSMA